jgi:ribonuclease HII
MLIYAGIDEAGYGPMFGPLVIARAVLAVDEADPASEPPDLWDTLHTALCRKPSDRRRRIAVNDSKQLYSPAAGVGHIERGVLSFTRAAGLAPANLDELLSAVAFDPPSGQPDQLWYLCDDGGPALPAAVDAGRLAIAQRLLARALEGASVRVVELSAAVVFEDRFNRMVQATRSKARCSWTFVSGHLDAIWQRHAEHAPRVIVDRQGGRRQYRQPLGLAFEGAELREVERSPIRSAYVLRAGPRRMTVSFEVDGDAGHLPVALASMTAKYVRELLMMRFNTFWQHHAGRIAPTAGYAKDGKRFLDDIEAVIDRLNIDRAGLIRRR